MKNILILLSVFTVGAAIGRWSLPASIHEVEKIVYQEKIVVKEVKSTTQDRKNNKVYVRIVTTKPDGTKVVETRIVDKDEIVTVNNSTTDTSTTVAVTTDKEKLTTYSNNNYLISLGAHNFLSNPSYSLLAQRRIVGPFYLGASIQTDRSYSAHLGMIF